MTEIREITHYDQLPLMFKEYVHEVIASEYLKHTRAKIATTIKNKNLDRNLTQFVAQMMSLLPTTDDTGEMKAMLATMANTVSSMASSQQSGTDLMIRALLMAKDKLSETTSQCECMSRMSVGSTVYEVADGTLHMVHESDMAWCPKGGFPGDADWREWFLNHQRKSMSFQVDTWKSLFFSAEDPQKDFLGLVSTRLAEVRDMLVKATVDQVAPPPVDPEGDSE